MKLPHPIAEQVASLDPTAQAVVALLWSMHEQTLAELQAMREQNEKFRQMLFGRRSEKLPPISDEVRTEVEEEDFPLDLPASATTLNVKQARAKERRKRGRHQSEVIRERRRKALAKLPVVRQQVTVSDSELPAGTTRADFRTLGDGEVVRRIEHVREHLVVIEYRLEKLVERAGDRIVQASAPANVIDGGAWGPSVYARVVVAKCVDSMPLYRQERALGRAGYAIARSVLCDLFHRAAEVLEPIYNRLIEQVRHNPYVHADETRLRVAEPHRARTCWVWTLLAEDIAAYIFSETRAAETANHLLAGTNGHLIVDGYSGYNGVVGEGKRTRVGCWAHSRRKFFEALQSAPEARELLDLIVALYRVEHHAADEGILGTEAHWLLRQAESKPVVDKIFGWVDERKEGTRPKSPLGQALVYADNQRVPLHQFLSDSKLPLDNNAAERALRIVAVGRKNFLFVGHEQGGKNLAILQTICSTCTLNSINPYEYIQDIVVRVRTHPNSRIDELLPMNWKRPPDTRPPPELPEGFG